jgi:hypothetical protein
LVVSESRLARSNGGFRGAASPEGSVTARIGGRLAERLVRPLVVVNLAEAIEAALLCAPVARNRLAGLSLECAMESLVRAVLLRVGRFVLRTSFGMRCGQPCGARLLSSRPEAPLAPERPSHL